MENISTVITYSRYDYNHKSYFFPFLPGDFDEFTQDNNDIMLKNIAEDLRNCLPLETMLSSEHLALQKVNTLY